MLLVGVRGGAAVETLLIKISGASCNTVVSMQDDWNQVKPEM